MWVEDEDCAAAECGEESGLSSEDEGDIQYEILEMQRDEANQRLSELEEVSNQLLKEMNVLEIQFQIERSCRESAEALAVQVTKENKVLKRRSQMLMPLIPEMPENLSDVTFDPETDPVVNGDVVDSGESSNEETLLLQSQAKIAELQASVDSLLAEKLQLEQQVEVMSRDQVQLREQLALEVEEKEAILRRMNKQSKTMNKIKRVSQLVTEEFTEMSQKLELEQGLRQQAEVFAHQMFVQQTVTDGPSTMQMQSSDTGLQLQKALEQISNINTALCDIQRYYQDQSQSSVDDSSFLSELQNLRVQLKKSEEERKALETQLSEANSAFTKVQDEVRQLQDVHKRAETTAEPQEEKPIHAPPPPPPPPPPPTAPTTYDNTLDLLRSRRKDRAEKTDQNNSAPAPNLKTKAIDEMMERIKKGIVLRPTSRIQDDDGSWKDQRNENRKSAVVELKGMLNTMKRQTHRRVPSRKGIGRNVGEAELLAVLQRRRKAMGDTQEPRSSAQTQDPQPGQPSAPVVSDVPWAGERGNAPVLRRLKQNREKRDSRIRASALIVGQEH